MALKNSPSRIGRTLCALSFITLITSGCASALLAGAVITTVDVLHDRRTMGEYIDDSTIELAANNVVAQDKTLRESAEIKAVSWNGILLLTGETSDIETQQKITKLMARIRGVRQVVDETSVREEAKLIDRSKDAWLSAKIKTKLFSRAGLDGNRVKVVTRNRIVYLMGIVTQQERVKITRAVSSVRGVEKIVRVFEYVESENENKNESETK